LIVGFLQLSLCVRDLERSLRFYAEALGCEVGKTQSFAGAATATDGRSEPVPPRPTIGAGETGRAVVVTRDGLRIELFELDAARPFARNDETPLPLHLVFAVDDLESTLHSLRDRGVPVLEETRTRLAVGVVSCFVADPDGLPIQLYQAPVPPDP
jgi:catechol 2,3-dioxygenase-like lactoylglutathione lyase family enzyme